jgi:hypothetical protein
MIKRSRIAGLFLLIASLAAPAHAQDEVRTFLSPGVKFGYQFGVGMFAGLEISYTVMPRSYSPTYGATFNVDLLRSGGYKLHLGIQGSSIIGGEVGPTYAKEYGQPGEWGFAISLFGLVGFMPYYTYTDLLGRQIHEGGILIKLPLQTKGRELGSLFKT